MKTTAGFLFSMALAASILADAQVIPSSRENVFLSKKTINHKDCYSPSFTSAPSVSFYRLQPGVVQPPASNSFAFRSLQMKGSDRDQPIRSYFIDLQGGLSSLYNKDINQSDDWETQGVMGFQVHIGYQKRSEGMNHLLAYGAGIGISTYGAQLNSKSTLSREVSGQVDHSTDPSSYKNYTAKLTYSGITEKTKLTYLDIPVFVELGNQSLNKVGYFLKLGVKFSYNIIDTFEGQGNYDQKCYYPEYDLELPASDLPGLFQFEGNLYNGQTNYALNKFNVTGSVSGGITFPLASNLIVIAGPRIELGLLGINADSDKSDPEYWSNFNHYLETSGAKTFTRAFGLEIGIHKVLSIF